MGAKKRANKELARVEDEITYWRDKIEEEKKICNPSIEVLAKIDRMYGYVNELQHQRGLLWRVLNLNQF